MKFKPFICAALLIASSACVVIPPAKSDGVDIAFGQTAYVDGPKIRPIKLLEDSRCPMNACCVWAGRVRILVAWEKAGGEQEVELTLGEPSPLADGTLTLTAVNPSKMAGEGQELAVGDYRFSFQFAGGY